MKVALSLRAKTLIFDLMAGNANTQIIPANSQEMQSEADNQKTKILEANTSDLHAILKRATLQANLGNWEAVLSDAVTAREMDPRSVDAWKLCARAGLAGGDMDATLDCLHEALLIDCNEREANTFLESAVDVHLNKTLAVR